MKKVIVFVILYTFLSVSYILADTVFLKSISIKGNRITKNSYILSKVDIETGKTYDVNELMNKMNKIKSRLQNTGLFENVYFDDQSDNNGNLSLTIKVEEKNYLLFGPEGNIYFKNDLQSDILIYLKYTNLFGLNQHLKVSLPIYENRGVLINFETDNQNRFMFESSFEITKTNLDTSFNKDFLNTNLLLSYNIGNFCFIGAGFVYNRYNDSSLIFYPLIKYGSFKRPKSKDSWFFNQDSLKIGYGEDNKLIYGVNSNIYYFKDLLLQIIFHLGVSIDYLDGDVPKNLILSNTARGYPENYTTGNKRISSRADLFIPLQWFPKLAVSLFVDSDFIGYNNLKFIIGGGIGIRWFGKYQDPLVIDFAFGKGFEINLSKKI